MSMIRCTRCSDLIDSDDDPECFIENPGVPTGFPEQVLCEPCRERAEDDASEPTPVVGR